MLQWFNPENRFWNFMNKIMDVCMIGVLWFLFSLPVITMGAATTALYQFTLKQTDDEEGYVWRSFWNAFRRNFLPATALWLMTLAAAAFLAADLWACLHMTVGGPIRIASFGLLMCLILIVSMTVLYLFPILARFHMGVKTIVKHAFITAMGNLYVSVTILVIYVVFGVLTYYITILFPIWMALAAFVSSYFFRSVFNRYRQEPGEPAASENPEE